MSRDDEETRAEDKDAYFVSYREVKVGKRVKVYLTKGGSDARRKQKPEEVLAAVGEDSGSKTGARFRNAANFTEHGHLDSDSRREVSEWLDGIVAEGLAREAAAGGGGGSDDSPGGGLPERDMDAAATAAAATAAATAARSPTAVPLASMTFVNHSQEKFVFPDGRRGVRFYLVDENGVAVPAAVGEERDTRDGHYAYRKDDAFTRGPPLTCGNLIGVSRWLRDQCVNGALIGAPLAGFGSHPPKRKGGGGKRGEAGRGREGGFGNGEDGKSALYGKDGASMLGGNNGSRENAIASIDPHWYADKKRKRDSRFFAADHAGDDVEPPSAAVALAEREARWAAARRAALAYAREDADADDLDAIEDSLKRLRACEPFCGHDDARVENASRKHKSRADEEKRAAAADATRALDALRALEARHVNVSVLRETNVCASVARLKTHADATVRRAAAALLLQWLAALRSSVGTLAASYERPPAPRGGASGGGGGARGGAVSGAAGKPPRPKPVYDAAFIASRRNEPELRRTRESRDEVMRREAAERSAREAAAKAQREAAAARAAANKAAKAAAAAAAHSTKDSEHGSDSVPNGSPKRKMGIPSSSRDDADRKKSRGGSLKSGGGSLKSGAPGTPLGKGRKLCTGCSTVVGSPTRVCPHCNATLPLKQTNGPGAAARADPGSSPRAGGAGGASGASGASGSQAQSQSQSQSGPGSQYHFFPGVPAGPRAAVGSSPPRVSLAGGASFGAHAGEALPAALEPPTGGGGSPGAPNAVALYLARHQERFASCKVSQLKRAVAELAAGVKRILDAGRVTDPALVKSLRESMKKMGDVKLLQGVVERPRARREVIAHLEAAVKTCRARGA